MDIPVTSLRRYLLRSQIYLSALVLVVCVVGMTAITAHTFKTYSEHNLQLTVQVLTEQIRAATVLRDTEAMNDTVQKFIQKYPLDEITITDNEQQVLSHFSKDQKRYPQFINRLKNRLISPESGYASVTHSGQPIAQVRISTDISPIFSFLQLFLAVFIFSFIFAYLIIYASTRLIFAKISTSLQKLTTSTEAVAKERDFNQRIPESDIEEFHIISESFNSLIAEIQLWHNRLQEENQTLEHQANHDPLTQLPNRAYFNQQLNLLFNDPNQQQRFALLYVDNNGFKAINDTYGHAAGDAVLKEMAMRLRTALRQNDFVARLGGDEFAILLKDITQTNQALAVAQHLHSQSIAPLYFAEQPIQFGFSIGVALSQDAHSADQLLHQADRAMYQAKQAKQNQHIALYHAD